MDSYYNAQRTKNIFVSQATKPYKLSRARIETFMRCRRCFYLDRKCGTEQPPMFPYTLNNAVDALLKKEFDSYRIKQQPHPLMLQHGVNAVPFEHENLDDWRMNQRGIKFLHPITNFIVTGALDDVWVNLNGELIVVDYKATSTKNDVSLNDRDSYKRQMEVYQWLLRKNGFNVSDIAYFVYCNGISDHENFAGTLNFKISLLPYHANAAWVDNTLIDIKNCLMSNKLPESSTTCDYCKYYEAVYTHIQKHNML